MNRIGACLALLLWVGILVSLGISSLISNNWQIFDECGRPSLGIALIGLGILGPIVGSFHWSKEQVYGRMLIFVIIALILLFIDNKLGTHLANLIIWIGNCK